MKKIILILILISSIVLACFYVAQKPLLILAFKDGKCGYINQKGEIKIPFIYDYGSDFNDNLAMVCIKEKCGYVNKKGKVIIPLVYDSSFDFNEGLATVRKGDFLGYINKKNDIVIPLMYKTAFLFSNGLAPVCIKGDKCGYVDRKNNIVIPFVYSDLNSFSEGLASVFDGKKWKAINKRNETVLPPKFSFLSAFENSRAAACVFGRSAGCGIIDKKGKEVVPMKYFWVDQSNKPPYAFEINSNSWGYMDKDFKLTLSRYYLAQNFTEGLAGVCVEYSKCGYINKNGNIAIKPIYQNVTQFRSGMAAVNKDDKWGFIDKKGKIITPCQYEAIGSKW